MFQMRTSVWEVGGSPIFPWCGVSSAGLSGCAEAERVCSLSTGRAGQKSGEEVNP